MQRMAEEMVEVSFSDNGRFFRAFFFNGYSMFAKPRALSLKLRLFLNTCSDKPEREKFYLPRKFIIDVPEEKNAGDENFS